MKRKENDQLLDQTQLTFDNKSSAFSNMECTGLAPRGIRHNELAEGYKELYDMSPPKTPEGFDTDIDRKSKGRR